MPEAVRGQRGVHLRVVASDSSPDVARASRPWVWSGMGVPVFWRRFAPSMGGTPYLYTQVAARNVWVPQRGKIR